MSTDVGQLLARYARLLAVGGGLVTVAALAVDLRWIDQPVAVLLLTGMVFALRAAPIRLSKYSYLTQTGIPVLIGAVTVGPYVRVNLIDCRDFTHTVTIGGQNFVKKGTACREADGSWTVST